MLLMYLLEKANLDALSLVRHLFLKLNLLKNLLKSCLFILSAKMQVTQILKT